MTPTDQFPSSVRKAIVSEGTLDAVKIGTGENYISAFGVFLRGTPLQIGILSTLPPLLGSIFQSVGVWLMERASNRKVIVQRTISFQGLIWLPIALIPFLFEVGPDVLPLLILLVVAYQISIGILQPVWNSWIGDLVPSDSRGKFFGFRNKYIAVMTCVGIASTGVLLDLFKSWGLLQIGFLIAFLIAGTARFSASRSLKDLHDPIYSVDENLKFSFWQFLIRGRRSNFVRFVWYVSGMNFAVMLSGPYTAVYMLRDLKLSYLEYTCVIGSVVLAQFLVMQNWGRISDQFGNRKILAVCGWQVALNPLLWMVSSHVIFLTILQFYAGVFWAGFNLASANFVFDAVSPPKRARCFAYQGIVNGLCVFAGSVVGGVIVTRFADYLPFHHGFDGAVSPFMTLFVLSALARLSVVVYLLPRFTEVRPVKSARHRDILKEVVIMRPFTDTIFNVFSKGSFKAKFGTQSISTKDK